MRIFKLSLPLTITDIRNLSIGDKVLLSGTLYTARDQAHHRLLSMLDDGLVLPFDLAGTALFYCGPSPKPFGKSCGAIGPTTSGRMDKYTIQLLNAGLRVMIGKGERCPEVQQAIKEKNALYLVAVGGASAVLAQSIVSCETFLWQDRKSVV